MTPDALLFDVDDVLAFRDDEAAQLWRNEMVSLGVDMESMDEISSNWNIKKIMLTEGSLTAEVSRRLSEQGVTLSAEAYLQGWFRAGFMLDHQLIARIGEWSAAAGKPVFLATNNYSERKAFLWTAEESRLCDHFTDIACSSDLGVTKQDPAYFTRAEQRLNLEGKRLKFFDDNAENIEVARSKGWDGEVFSRESGRARVLQLLTGMPAS